MIKGLLESAGIPSFVKQAGVDGPSLGFGWLSPGGGSQWVMVPATRSEEARALLDETLAEGEGGDWTDLANANHLEEARGGRKPRDYGLIGAYARIWAWSVGLMALAFAVFMLLRVV